MYRAVTLAGLRAGIDLTNQAMLAKLLDNFRLEMTAGRVVVNGDDVTDAIRSPDVTAASGAVANSPVVRARLVDMQRALAAGRDIVCEGRDQGTVVFPDAACKFFLVADPAERARRRQQDLAARGDHVPLEDILRAQEERDRRDAARDIGPMKPAPDAILLDSTQLTLDEVVQRMEGIVRRKMKSTP